MATAGPGAGLTPRATGGTDPPVSARSLTKTYTRAGQAIPVLKQLDLDVARGEFVAFMGRAIRLRASKRQRP